MSGWNKTLYSFIAMTNLKMLWNQFLNFCFTQYIALFIAIFHQVLQYDFSGNIHFYCKIKLPLFYPIEAAWFAGQWVPGWPGGGGGGGHTHSVWGCPESVHACQHPHALQTEILHRKF